MLAEERRRQILAKLHEEKRVIVSELSREFGVSEETIRRDLERFEKEDLVTKSYGGAVLNEHVGTELPFKMRKKNNMMGKRVIGQLLAEVISDGDHILLDPSTTSVSIVQALRSQEKEHLSIITNSLEVLAICAEDDTWEVISTGGTLQTDKYALVGPQAIAGIESFQADKAIISCKGLDMKKGLTDINDMFSQVKQTMFRNATQRILAVDYTKFDNVGFSRICEISQVDLVVTDVRPQEAWMQYFDDRGIRCIYGNGEMTDTSEEV